MKKIVALILCLTITFGIPVLNSSAGEAFYLYGDVNTDYEITSVDSLLSLQFSVKKILFSELQKQLADVDSNGNVDAVDALLILEYSIEVIDSFKAGKYLYIGEMTKIYAKGELENMSMQDIIDSSRKTDNKSRITDYYDIHPDGGMIYNPLSRELSDREKTKYDHSDKTNGNLVLSNGAILEYSVPTSVTALDIIPIDYTVLRGTSRSPIYVDATTFEEGNGHYYDLCLPGNIMLDFEYEGYVTATADAASRAVLSKNFTADKSGTSYPSYNASALIASDNIKYGDYTWFKFKITNTGDTILDSDGNGTFCLQPFLDGVQSDNMFYRLTEDLYPGQSTEMYFYFGNTRSPNKISKGNHTITVDCLVRNEQQNDDWEEKIWGGYKYGTATKEITVSDNGANGISSQASYVKKRNVIRNTWLHTYEEYTTSFDSWLCPDESQTGRMYVQVAPWSNYIALKFMQGNFMNMESVNIPLKIDTDSVSIQLNPTADNYIVRDDGTKYPAMASQTMCDMRVNISQSPYADEAQLKELMDMKDCGVNLVTTTEAFNTNADYKTGEINNLQDAIWFVSDAVRKLGMRMEGYVSYPYNSGTNLPFARWLTGENQYSIALPEGYANPVLAKADGIRACYQYARWGDNFYVNSKNNVVFNVEDTRGWLRIDYNARANLGEQTKTDFRNWLKTQYSSIDRLNAAWNGSKYSSFNEIDPESDTKADHDWRSYVEEGHTFSEWSPAVTDLDIYRTLERTQNYQTVIDTMKTGYYGHNVSNGSMGIRTEGGNILGVVPSDTPYSHLRHAYYSQRRCAIIPEIIAKAGNVSMHSDYVTLPYSVKEWSALVASAASLGITEMPLMNANRMRDIAINKKYGADYSTHYNIPDGVSKGAYINTQTSVFQIYKAVYEAGGIPGALWEDYLCDGFITKSQQKDMKFYSEKIAEMMNTSEAKKWATANVQNRKQAVSTSLGKYSYTDNVLDSLIRKVTQTRYQEQNKTYIFEDCEQENKNGVDVVNNINSGSLKMTFNSENKTQGNRSAMFTKLYDGFDSFPMILRNVQGFSVYNAKTLDFDIYLSDGMNVSSGNSKLILQRGGVNNLTDLVAYSIDISPQMNALKTGWNHVSVALPDVSDMIYQVSIAPGNNLLSGKAGEYILLDNVLVIS